MNLKKLARTSGLSFLAFAATQAHAAGTVDYTTLTSSVSFSDVGVAIMAVGVTVIAYHVLEKGAEKVIKFVRKA